MPSDVPNGGVCGNVSRAESLYQRSCGTLLSSTATIVYFTQNWLEEEEEGKKYSGGVKKALYWYFFGLISSLILL